MQLLNPEGWQAYKAQAVPVVDDGSEALTMKGYLRLPGMTNHIPSDEMYQAAARIEAIVDESFPGLDVSGSEIRCPNPKPTEARWQAHIAGLSGDVAMLSLEMYLPGPQLALSEGVDQATFPNPWDGVQFYAQFPAGTYRPQSAKAMNRLEPLIEGFMLEMVGPSIALSRNSEAIAVGLKALETVGVNVAPYRERNSAIL